MEILYGLVKEIHIFGDRARTSYGIAVYIRNNKTEEFEIADCIYDISSDREKLSELVCFCNGLSLSLDHLPDVVEDFLGCDD